MTHVYWDILRESLQLNRRGVVNVVDCHAGAHGFFAPSNIQASMKQNVSSPSSWISSTLRDLEDRTRPQTAKARIPNLCLEGCVIRFTAVLSGSPGPV